MGIKYQWGRFLMDRGAEEVGMRILRRAAKGGASDAAALLAEFLEGEGRLQEAAEVLKDCVRSGGTQVARHLADVVSAISGSSVEAEHWYRFAIEEKIPGTKNNFGCFLYSLDRTIEAEAVLKEAVAEGDEFASGNLGKLYFDLRDYDAAEFWLKSALGSGNFTALAYLVRIETERGDQEAASSYLEEALERDTEGASLAQALHLWRFSSGSEEEEIEAAFERSLDGTPQAHFHFANWLKSQSRLNEAIEQHKVAIGLGEVNSNLNLAIIMDDLGYHAETERHLRLGVAGRDADAAAALVRFLADQGRVDCIPRVIDEAVRLGHPKDDIARLRKIHRELLE
ncbi:hypothetical protein [Streptomyces halstedii]